MRFQRDAPSLLRKAASVAFVGNEAFFKEEALRRAQGHYLDTELCDEEAFDGTASFSAVEEVLEEYPLIGKTRLVTVRNTDKIKKWENFKEFLTDGLPNVKALFSFSDDLDDLPATWGNVGIKVVCNDIGVQSQEFEKYVDYCLEGTGKSLAADARPLVAMTFANNLAYMKHELQKASYYRRDAAILTREDLIRCLASYPIAKVFDLVEVVMVRDLRGAIYLVHDLLDQGTEPTFLIHLVAQRLKVLEGALSAQQVGERLKDYMMRKKVPLFQYDSILRALKSVRPWQLAKYYDALVQAEYHLKSFAEPVLEMETLVVQLCR
jgi:DNA polymerase III delta subunit